MLTIGQITLQCCRLVDVVDTTVCRIVVAIPCPVLEEVATHKGRFEKIAILVCADPRHEENYEGQGIASTHCLRKGPVACAGVARQGGEQEGVEDNEEHKGDCKDDQRRTNVASHASIGAGAV